MRKFTLFIASLFLAVGAMAQTFVMPETGKYYKIKGDNSQYPWLMGVQKSGGSGIAVSANEADAAIFEKTANGLKVYGTETYVYYSGSGDVTIGNTESNVVIGDYNNSTDSGTKYSVKVAGAYMYNNNTDQQVHTSGTFITNIERYWGFIEVNMGGNGDGEDDGKIVADGVYLIKNNYNNRGAMAYGTWSGTEYFGLTEITLNGCAGNNLVVADDSYKYWYVKTTDKGVYIYNLGKGYFLQERASEKATCATDIANGFTLVERTANNTKYVSVKSGNYYLSYSCGWAPNSNYGSVRWLTDDEAAATLMTFTAVDANPYYTQIQDANTKIAAFENGNDDAKAALAEAIAQAEAMLAAITVGDGVGEYSGGGYTKEELVSLLGSAKEFYNSIDASTSVETIEAYIEFVNGTMASYTLNMPEAGKYYRFQGNSGNYIDASSIYDNATAKVGQMSMKSDAECNLAGTIFYLDENGKLLNYHTGTYVTASREIANVGVGGNTWTISASSIAGKYKIKSNDGNWLHDNSGNRADRCNQDPDGHNETHSWVIEPVVELPVTITSAGYATFYAPVAVNIPEGVKAYTVSINEGGWADLEEIYLSFSPGTGVVLAAEEGTYYLPISEDNTVFEGNALRGTVEATYITDDAYVLGVVDNEVGFYTATKNQQSNSAWKNNSHKAYLPKAVGMNAASYSFRFGEGTTAIQNVEVENTVKVIYDLTGRRVEAITAPGIYIVGGKKVLVK